MKKIKRDSRMMKLIVILGIIILPLIYSLFYLKAFWDPYHELNKVPVALVNLDECKENCKGTELVNTLKEQDIFNFKVVSKEKAEKGLIDKDYYAIIEIPKNFTKDLNNIASKDRKPVSIVFKPNSKTNYLSSQIITSAVKQIEAELSSQVDKQIVLELTDNLQSVPEQTTQISDAFGTIYSGTNTLNNGAKELETGVSSLSTNYKTFNNGVEKLKNGANNLYNSYSDLNNGIETAYEGATTLKNKTESLGTLASKVGELENVSSDIINDTKNVYGSIIVYCNINDCTTNQYLNSAYMIAKDYVTPNTERYTKLQGLEQDMGLISNQTYSLNELKGGIDQLQTGFETLKNGSNKVYSGISELNNGLNTLNSSSNLIDNGINKIENGVNTLSNGTNTLNDGVLTAKNTVDEKFKSINEQTSELTGLDDYAKEPVNIHEEDYGDVKDYGTFFSPYFMSLSLWVGGILILMGLYYDPDQRFKILGRNSEHRGKRLLYYNIISIVQALVLGFLLKLILGFEVTNIFLYYGSCILISGAFLAVVMFLFFNFKDVGKFLSLVFLVTQLASCGGTFPIQTEPSIYQAIYPYMPMTYSVDLLRESFVSINSSLLTKDVIVLLLFFIGFNGLTFVTSMFKSKKEKGQMAELEMQNRKKKTSKNIKGK